MIEKVPMEKIKGREREKTGEKLGRLMLELAARVNEEFSGQIGGDLLDDDGKINMGVFRKSQGGPLEDSADFDAVGTDQAGILEEERRMSGASNPNTQKFFRESEGIEGEEGILARWREKRENSREIQAEKLITALLDRVLHERFLIVRASQHDDYTNSADNLIIDRETEIVVGAFDEVLDTFHRGKITVAESKKWDKIWEKNVKGGARIKYGLAFSQGKDKGKLIRQKLFNVPVFFLSLSGEEFERLARNIETDPDAPLSATEAEIFNNLMGSLTEQREALLRQNISGVMKPKIASFSRVIENMEKTRESLAAAALAQAA